MAKGIRQEVYGGKKLPAATRMYRAAAFGKVAKLYANLGQPEPAFGFAKKAAHEVSSPRMQKAIAGGGGGGEVQVRAYVRRRPS